MGYRRTADGGDELSSHFDDSGVLCFGADHETGDIVEEDDWGVSKIVRIFP